ncbi:MULTISPECIES: GbpC/Spa domain-containing protein [Lactobacillus]|uniref:YSIRK-type signal peptide-containing protein n=1 Tax=Lactobacillus xujianguonis TaxID=2495899 RepID=A0A437SSN9_9LACO|nr:MULTISPECIES: GbpC/Spa domain-containing protein [Lactobacillus]RVU69862.1 YSIRK-type signal peptide-containing protein [Lactobacillus xujianguonis]RVU71928.1 YSIRK-type signal peptide-containing protein [Lactobacillus xujianguonis]
MVSRKNIQEKIRKMEDRRERHSIRKLTMGAASVLIGLTFMGTANSQMVRASEIEEVQTTTSSHINEDINSENTAEIATNAQEQEVQTTNVVETPVESTTTTEVTTPETSNTIAEEKVETPPVENTSTTATETTTNVAEEKVETPAAETMTEVKDTTEKTTPPTYQESLDKVEEINKDNNDKLQDAIDKAEQEGIIIDTKDPIKIPTTTGGIDINKDKLEQLTQAEIDKINAAISEYQAAKDKYEKELSQYKDDLEKYNIALAEYNKARDEYIQHLKDLGLWSDDPNNPDVVDPADLKQWLILGKEDNATVKVEIMNGNQNNVIQSIQPNGPLLGIMDHYYEIKADRIDGDFLKVIYTNLQNSTYNGEAISKIEIIYSDWATSKHPYQTGKPGLYFSSNPIDGFFYRKADGVTIEMKFYDSKGNLIVLDENSAYITVGSLNSKGEGNDYVEKAEIINGNGHKGEGVQLPESSVTVHKGPNGDILYSDKNNELLYKKEISAADYQKAVAIWGKAAVDKYLGWDDATDRSKEIFGAGLFKVSGNAIKIRFSNELGSAWATFSTTIPNITFDKEKPKAPDKPTTPEPTAPTISVTPGQLELKKNSSVHIHYVDIHDAITNGLVTKDDLTLDAMHNLGVHIDKWQQNHEHLSIDDLYENILHNWDELGYELVVMHPDVQTGTVGEEPKHLYIYLKHKTEETSRDKVVNQTIHYIYEDGSTAAPDHVSVQLTFTQTGVKDLVTGETNWNGEWTKTHTFVSVTSPTIPGYTADRPEVGPYDITVTNDNYDDNLDKVDTVVYRKDVQPTDPQPTTPQPTDPQPTVPQPTDPQPTVPEPTTPPTPTPDPEPTTPTPDPAPTPEPSEPEEVAPKPELVPGEEGSDEAEAPKSEKTETPSQVKAAPVKAERVVNLSAKSSNETPTETTKSEKATLPQTGDETNKKAGAIGLVIAALGSLFALAGSKKRKKK